ncbi:UDP-N-acetylmuramoyl-tripeptide--D-alanyl-D-alanine ligase [subsurface metagenome]
MKDYTVKQVLKSLRAKIDPSHSELSDTEIHGISTDSRTIESDDVFFAIRGDRFDGADHVRSAFDNGAVLAVVNRDSMKNDWNDFPIVAVDDTVRSLGDTAKDYRAQFPGKVVAITGTSGKTMVKEMILAILGVNSRVYGTPGNFNNLIGVPLSLFGLDSSHEFGVFELGMSAPGEIADLADMAQPDIAVVLNVGQGHSEFFDSIDSIADAKAELLEFLDSRGTAVINGDDELLRDRVSKCRARVIRFGIESEADFKAENIKVRPDGCTSFDIGDVSITLNVPGYHMIYNALAAFTVGSLLGVDGNDAAQSLEDFRPPKMRLQMIQRNGIRFIDDTYNANPLSMKGAADVIGSIAVSESGRKIAVLGDMLELGEISEKEHRDAGKLFAGYGIDIMVCVGNFSDHYKAGALEGGMDPEAVYCLKDSDEAARLISEIACPGDVILVKGSRAVSMEKIITHISENV